MSENKVRQDSRRSRDRRNTRNTRRDTRKIWIPIIVAVVLLFVGIAVFIRTFHVDTIEVVGNTASTDQEVIDEVLKGPFTSNSMWCSVVINRVEEPDLDFVASVNVERVSSHKIRLHVNEKQMVGYVKYLDCFFYFDKNGTVVESQVADDESMTNRSSTGENTDDNGEEETSEEESSVSYHSAVTDITYVTGLVFDNVQVNKTLPVERTSVFNTIQGITRIVDKYEIPPDSVEFDKTYQITLHYGDIQILIGSDTLLEEKIIRAAAILPKLEGKAGILHLEDYTSDTTNVIFSQNTESEQEDSQGEESDEDGDSDSSEDDQSSDSGDGDDSSAEDDDNSYGDEDDSYEDEDYSSYGDEDDSYEDWDYSSYEEE